MALQTTLEQLEQVQAAITAIESGAQSYMMGDIRVTKGTLQSLYDRETRLRVRYNRGRQNGGRIRLNLSRGT